jgi:hypothetical protein
MDFGFNLAETSLCKVFHTHPHGPVMRSAAIIAQVPLSGPPMAKRFFGGSQECGW